MFLERNLKEIKQLIFKDRQKNLKEVFHLYEFRVKNFKLRDKLVNFLKSKGIDAKIHYPIPMHLQPAAKVYNIKKGSYPITEKIAKSTISLPVHEYIKLKDLKFMINTIKKFFNESTIL